MPKPLSYYFMKSSLFIVIPLGYVQTKTYIEVEWKITDRLSNKIF